MNDQDSRSQDVVQAFVGRPVLVTGGASFIGSHLVDALVAMNARVRVVDDLSSGKLANIRRHVDSGAVEFARGDLLDSGVAAEAVGGMHTVFHLAANHGGRGYVDLHQADCATNLILDGVVLRACRLAGVEKIVYASSGCVYPNHLQTDPTERLFLTEDQVGPPLRRRQHVRLGQADGRVHPPRPSTRNYGLKSVSCRYFTVYGPRGHENHAVMAMIARAFIRQDPFRGLGLGPPGTQLDLRERHRGRNAPAPPPASTTPAPFNLGTRERLRVVGAVCLMPRVTGHWVGIRRGRSGTLARNKSFF